MNEKHCYIAWTKKWKHLNLNFLYWFKTIVFRFNVKVRGFEFSFLKAKHHRTLLKCQHGSDPPSLNLHTRSERRNTRPSMSLVQTVIKKHSLFKQTAKQKTMIRSLVQTVIKNILYSNTLQNRKPWLEVWFKR
jgi:hypothetical protein